MKTILEDKVDTEFNANEEPNKMGTRCQKMPNNIFGKVESVEAKINMEVLSHLKSFRVRTDVFGSSI